MRLRAADAGIWIPETVKSITDETRSYFVETNEHEYRRNRRDLLKLLFMKFIYEIYKYEIGTYSHIKFTQMKFTHMKLTHMELEPFHILNFQI